MVVEAVVFDVGETLVDETRMWERAAVVAGVTPFTLIGNTPVESEAMLRPYVDVLGSSGRFGSAKPAPAFFTRIVELVGLAAARIAYVGDRVDNDVGPALRAGMVAVHIRRGPWGHLHVPPPEAIRIRSLDELPGALA